MHAEATAAASLELRVGLAGLGRFGKLHASDLDKLPGVRHAALCDTRPDKHRSLGQLCGVPEDSRYTDYERTLAETALDAVAGLRLAEAIVHSAESGREIRLSEA